MHSVDDVRAAAPGPGTAGTRHARGAGETPGPREPHGAQGLRASHPATRWQDAFLTGNGRHGALVLGGPVETVVVTHHALVLPGPSRGVRAPDLADRLEEVRDLVLAGRGDEALDRFTDGRPTLAVQPFHPAFALRLSRRGRDGEPDPAGASRAAAGASRAAAGGSRGAGRDDPDGLPGYQRTLDLSTGVATARWTGRDGTWRSECFVSRADDVVVQRIVRPGGGAAGRWDDVRLVHDVRLPGAPPDLVVTASPSHGGDPAAEALATGVRAVHVTYPRSVRSGDAPVDGGPADSGTPDDGPAGGYVGVTRVVVGATEALLLTRVARHGGRAPSSGSDPGGRDPGGRDPGGGEPGGRDPGCPYPGGFEAERDCRRVLLALDADYDGLLARHVAEHRPAFDRVSLELDVGPADRLASTPELLERARQGGEAALGRVAPALLERLFAAGRYHLLSASGIRPPRLVGLWQGDWDAAWSASFTLDANLGLQLAGAVAGGVPEAVDGLARLVADQLDDWRDNARRLFGVPGVVAPVHTDGENGASLHFNRRWPLHLWTAGADWLLVPMLDQARATGDTRFLRTRVRPLLAEVVRFYEGFLTRLDGDGHVVAVPSYSPENAPRGASPAAAVNATMDLAAARHALHAALELARLDPAEVGPAAVGPAGLDPAGLDPETARWRALLGALPPYRVNADGALAEWAWAGLEDDYDHRHVSHLYPVWPLHEITPHRTPELAAAARRALRLRGDENGSAHGYVHRALVAARLREPALLGELLARLLTADFCFDNLMTSHYPGRDLFNADAACALPGVLLEALVDSEPGRVELLPAVPGLMPAGRLRGARTVARLRVEDLRWDLRVGTASATLVADTAQRVTLACPGAESVVETWPGARVRAELRGTPVPPGERERGPWSMMIDVR